MAEVKRRVAYYYRGDVGNYYYGAGHPMKPVRMKLAHHLLLSYGLYRQLEVYRPHLATAEEMKEFHSSDYIDFLSRITPENMHEFAASMSKFGIGEFSDCPVFSGLYDYCRIHAGASIDGAVRLNHGHADVAINWSGGLHHAKKSEASGFCYVNDIVLAILELLKYHPRVLYVDIDIHHGDGVEEAFYTTDRVMTCSFHKFGDFFPGTGDIRHIGHAEGKHYAINFPLRSGIDDLSYEHVFKPVVAKIMEVYQPTAVVLQCGADSLTGDRLGSFNLTVKGHAECVKFVKSFGLPTLMVGGGGYTVRNVARAWCYETSVMLGTPVADAIPPSDYIEFFRPDYRLHLTPAAMPNQNTPEYLERCKVALLESLRGVAHAPSVPFQYVPPDWARLDDTDDDTRGLDPDVRISRPEGRRDAPGEYYNDDKDHDQPGDDAEEEDDDKDADDDVEGEDNERDTPMTHVGDGAASSSSEASRSRKRPRGESSPPPVAAAEAAAAATSAAATVVEAAASPVAPAAATVASAPDVVQVAPAAVSAGDSVDVKPKLDDEGNAAAQGAQADALSGAAVAASTAGTTSGDESTSKRSKLAAEAQPAAVEAAAPTAASGSAAEAKSEQLLLDASEMVGGAGVPARMTDGDKGDDEAETPAAAAPVAETQPIQAAAPAAAAAASQTAAAAPASEAAAGGAPAPTA